MASLVEPTSAAIWLLSRHASASDRSPASRTMRKEPRTATGAFSAMSAASASASSTTLSLGTTRFTSPSACARGASIGSPVIATSVASASARP